MGDRMNKIINIIVVSFFSSLCVNNDIGLYIYIPILYLLCNKYFSNLIIFILFGLISTYVFNSTFLLSIIIIYIIYIIYRLIIMKLFLKEESIYLDIIFIGITILVILIFNNNSFSIYNVIKNVILFLVCIIIYILLKYNIDHLDEKKKIYSFSNIEVIVFAVSVLGGNNIDSKYPIAIILSVYFIMYLSKSGSGYHSLFFSIIIATYFIFYEHIKYSFILPFISALYLLDGLWSSIILISISFLLYISNQTIIEKSVVEGIIFISIFFELIRNYVTPIGTKVEEVYKDAYNKTISSVNNDILQFATFLDMYSKEFVLKKEYLKIMDIATNELKNNICSYCYMKESCHRNNKTILYKYLSEIIIFSKRSDYSSETFQHIKKCPYIKEMMKEGVNLNKKYDISGINIKSNALVGILNGISNILRMYVVDNSIKLEIDYKTIYDIKKDIIKSGINLCYYSPVKNIINDYEFEIGVRGENIANISKRIETIFDNYISGGVTVNQKRINRDKIYFTVTPKNCYTIDYGYCNYCADDNSVSGDNCLIKDINSTISCAVICDGMGKGYEANDISYNVLKMIEQVLSSNITPGASVEILNTFYYIERHSERYSTLDMIEINKINGEVTFYKLGASGTYIYSSKNGINIIENKSLPFGVEESIEGVKYKASDGDLIIMASDGVFDSVYNKEEIEMYIKQIYHMPSQKIVFEISNFIKNHKRIDMDDMSIIAMKINKIN